MVDTTRYKIRRHFPLLAGSYDESSLATALANMVAELLRSVVESKVEEIKRRKMLSTNEVQTDEEIIELLNQRDSEGRRLSAALRKALFVRKKQASERASLEAEVRAAVNSIRVITYDRLAKKLNRHSANALRMEMRRTGLSIKDFKKTNK